MSGHEPLVAIYPGSFDPITKGHEDLVRRSLNIADEVVVAVAHTSSQAKKSMFSVEERVELIRSIFSSESRVQVEAFRGLMVDFARSRGARLVVRGLRAVSDFEYELQMAQMNRELLPELETVFLAPEVEFSFVSSSLIREISSLGGDVGRFVSQPVAERIRARTIG
jgi:pantetheine-phosphate adenylyltransferase